MKFRVVSLFSGAGGLDLGFEQTNRFKTVWANDIDRDAVSTFSSNFDIDATLGEISSIQSSEIPECDVIVGGFPCQGFSVANTGRRIDDSRNELYLEMLRVVRDKMPRAFVAENVKGLMQMAKGEVLRRILEDFRDLGYKVQWRLLNAADYGVPQMRERVIIVGTRHDAAMNFEFPQPSHDAKASGGKLSWVTSGEALSILPDPDTPNDLLNHTYSRYKLRFNGYIGNRAVDPDRPAPTVTGRGDNRGGVVVLHHPSNTRRMSVRELATIQSFPLDFHFKCNQSAAYRLIGNAVPPRLGHAIGAALASTLDAVVPQQDAGELNAVPA